MFDVVASYITDAITQDLQCSSCLGGVLEPLSIKQDIPQTEPFKGLGNVRLEVLMDSQSTKTLKSLENPTSPFKRCRRKKRTLCPTKALLEDDLSSLGCRSKKLLQYKTCSIHRGPTAKSALRGMEKIPPTDAQPTARPCPPFYAVQS